MGFFYRERHYSLRVGKTVNRFKFGIGDYSSKIVDELAQFNKVM